MKKLIILLLLLVGTLGTLSAQTPEAFNYQAVVRDAQGQPIANTQVNFRMSLIDEGSRLEVFQETHLALTDEFGRVTLRIGEGKAIAGNFEAIDWAGSGHSLKVEMDPAGGHNFAELGSSRLLSVPYALHAKTVDHDQVNDADADPSNELQNLELRGDTLEISGGNFVVLSGISGGFNPENMYDDGDWVVGPNNDILHTNKLVGIRTQFPQAHLDVVGKIRMADSTEQDGYVMVSDSNGVATWIDPTTLGIDTDDQTLSLSGTNLSIADGNTVDLASIDTDTDTDDQTLGLSGTNLSIADGNTVDLASIDTDDQTLGLSGTNLSIADGNTVDLASIDTDTDDQTLSLSGTTLSIADGNTVDLASIDTDTDTDDQTLGLSGTNLSIADGNTVDLASINTDNQTLSLSGTTLSIADGNTVDLASIDTDTDTDDQTLSLSGTNLSIADGNSVDLSGLVDDGDWTVSGSDLYRSGGNVAIGTTSASERLEIADGNVKLSRVNNGSGTKVLAIEGEKDNEYWWGNYAEVQFMNTDANVGGSGNPYVGAKIGSANTQGTEDGDLRFYTYNDSLYERMVIENKGNVGIGTADPTDELHVIGSIRMEDGNEQNGHVLVSNSDGKGTWTDPSTLGIDTDTDDQTLSLSGTSLSIADGNSVDLASIDTDTDTDDQTLSLSGTTLSIADGNSVNLASIDTDDQTLSLSGNTLSIANGNSLSLSGVDDQTLSLSGTTLSIADGNSVNLASIDTDTDDQTLSLSGTTLSIADGNSVNLTSLVDDGDWTVSGSDLYRASGNVAIGTTSASEKMEIADGNLKLSRVNGGSTTKELVIEGRRDNEYNWGNYAEIKFMNTDGNQGGSNTPYVGAKIGSANTAAADDGDLRFYTYDGSLAERMVITNTGAIGFGTQEPDFNFDMVASSDGMDNYIARFRNTANSNGSRDEGILIQAGHNSYNSSNKSGFVQFETPGGTYCGRIYQNGSNSVALATSSDRRLKDNIRPSAYGLADLLKIQVADYNYKTDGPEVVQTGFIAQQLHTVFPHAVYVGGEDEKTDPWSVSYGDMTPLLVKAVQEQQQLIDAQNARIESQQAEIAALRSIAGQVEALNARLQAMENALPAGTSQVSLSGN